MGFLKFLKDVNTVSKAAGARNPDLITAIVQQEKSGKWGCSFVGDGYLPKDVSSATMQSTVDEAIAVVGVDLPKHGGVDGVTLQFAIYPWPNFSGATIFDISGTPGTYSANNMNDTTITVDGATLDSLVSGIEQVTGTPQPDVMLRWERLASDATPC